MSTDTESFQVNAPQNLNRQTIQMKRSVTVKTIVTDAFRQRAQSELDNELKLIDTQSQQLEAQYQGQMQQLEKLAQQGQNVEKQMAGLNQEAQQKRNQLAQLKMQISSEMGNLQHIENGRTVVTGILENMVDIRVGDNLYDKLMNAEIIVEDGVVKSIRG